MAPADVAPAIAHTQSTLASPWMAEQLSRAHNGSDNDNFSRRLGSVLFGGGVSRGRCGALRRAATRFLHHIPDWLRRCGNFHSCDGVGKESCVIRVVESDVGARVKVNCAVAEPQGSFPALAQPSLPVASSPQPIPAPTARPAAAIPGVHGVEYSMIAPQQKLGSPPPQFNRRHGATRCSRPV